MAWQLIGALVSGAFTMMGTRQQVQTMKANAAWQRYENELNSNYEKQKRLTEQQKLLSNQRARGGASGVVVGTGSSLLAMQADMDEFENDMWFLEKGLFAKTKANDSELAGQISGTYYKAGASLLDTYSNYNQQTELIKNAKLYGTGKYVSAPVNSYGLKTTGKATSSGGIF